MKKSGGFLLLVCLVATVFFAVTGVALADKQTSPGMTERVIWDTVQVAAYKVNASHVGTIHAEVTFKPSWADFDIYIYDQWGNSVYEENLGYAAQFTGREIIDHYVSQDDFAAIEGSTDVIPEGPYGEPEHVRGIDYYVVIVAFNETAKFQVWGYTPYTDTSSDSAAVDYQWNYYFDPFRFPGKKTDWASLKGAPYGLKWDFMPTSEGAGEVRLQWPAKKVDGKWAVTYDPVNAGRPANMETYLYVGLDWDTVFEAYGYTWYRPKSQDGGTWYGHKNAFDVSAASASAKPMKMYHYVPSCVGVVENPALGPFGGMREGISTIGYKATISFPQNLRMVSAPRRVMPGKTATFKGTFALNDAWVVGEKVSLQIMVDPVKKTWKTVKSVMTGDAGKWTIKYKPTKTAKFRVMAAGDDATGLVTELSMTKKVVVR